MKPYLRRAVKKYPYFKLAVFDQTTLSFRDGKQAFPTAADAKTQAMTPGRYRISQVNVDGRVDLEPFEVTPQRST